MGVVLKRILCYNSDTFSMFYGVRDDEANKRQIFFDVIAGNWRSMEKSESN